MRAGHGRTMTESESRTATRRMLSVELRTRRVGLERTYVKIYYIIGNTRRALLAALGGSKVRSQKGEGRGEGGSKENQTGAHRNLPYILMWYG